MSLSQKNAGFKDALFRTSFSCAFAVSAFLTTGAAGNADQSGFYLSVSSGNYVEYLCLNDSGRDVTGYLESIRASASAPGGETRSQTFNSSRSGGNAIVFGNRTAMRDGDGYVLTFATTTGQVDEQRFTRATIGRVNGSVAALSASVSRMQAQNDLNVARGELAADTSATGADGIRLAQAQKNIDASHVAQIELQRRADAMWAVARKLRLDANAAINTPGASFAQNQKSISAMKIADDAALSARAAQHEADAAGQNGISAAADLAALHANIAALTERVRFLSERLRASGDTTAHP